VPPVIKSFEPERGSINTLVRIKGTGFTKANWVIFFPDQRVLGTYVSEDTIEARVPQGTTTGVLAVENENGQSRTTWDFKVIEIAKIARFTPHEGVPGTRVTINGEGFSSAYSVLFGKKAETRVAVESDTQIKVNVPALNPSEVKLTVVTHYAGSAVSSNKFEVK
jgi:hypothetical protein